MDGGAKDREGSGEDQRDVHVELAAIRPIRCKNSSVTSRVISWRVEGRDLRVVFGIRMVESHPYSTVWKRLLSSARPSTR